MDPARYQRLKHLVHAASALPTGERRAWLTAACPADPELVAEALGFLESPVQATAAMRAPAVKESLHIAPGMMLGPYVLGAEIGRGGMGVVFQVAGRDGPPLAIKAIRPQALESTSSRDRFLREARLGLAIEHENVVRAVDVGEASVGGLVVPYLVMEHVVGRTLRHVLDEMGSAPEALVREIARQAARGLAALHAAGVVHRDIKPENLILTADRRLCVMDLGIAKVPGIDTSLTTEGHFIGSVRYAAPEQWEGKEVGPTADLYSLGTVLYELLAGRPPFDGETLLEIARSRSEARPPPVAQHAPSTSAFLASVVGTLLETLPHRRFDSSEQLAAVVESGEQSAWWRERVKQGRRSSLRTRSASPTVPLMGRREESAKLAAFWEQASAGHGQAVLIEGESGVGKSRLIEAFLDSLETEATVLVSGFGRGAVAPGLREALAGALAVGDPANEIARRLDVGPPRAAALAAYLVREIATPADDNFSAAEADIVVGRLLQSLAATAPVVWVVEDVHLAAPDALHTLRALVRTAGSGAILLLLAARSGLDDAFLADFAAQPHAHRLALGRLGERDMRALLEAALGGAVLTESAARVLAARCDGVPFFAVEIARDLERRGQVVREADGRVRLAAGFDLATLPRALHDLLRARIGELAFDERATLDMAAVGGMVFDPNLVAQVRGMPRLQVLEVLARLERRDGLVRSEGRSVRFDHQLLHEVVYAELPEALRQAAHEGYAEALERVEATACENGARASRVVWHRLRGPAPDSAAPLVPSALAWLAGTYRNEAALDLATRALALPAFATGTPRTSVLLQAVRVARMLGLADRLTGLLDEAVASAEAVGDVAWIAEATLRRISHASDVGRNEEALASCDALLAFVERAGGSLSTRHILSRRGEVLWCLGRHHEARATHERVLQLAEQAGDLRLVGSACSNLGVVLHEMGWLADAATSYERALPALRQVGDRANEAAALGNLGNVLHDQGRWADAMEKYEQALAIDRAIGAVGGEAFAWVNLGATKLALGDLEGAVEAYARCEEICRQTGFRRVLAFAMHGRGQAAAWQGDGKTARTWFERALEVRRAIANRPGLADTLQELGALDASEGRVAAARSHFDDAIALAAEVDDPTTLVLATLRRALLEGSDRAAARVAFERHVGRLRTDALVESRWLLWLLESRPEDLHEAQRVLAEQRSHAPARYAESMIARVPYRRAIAEAAGEMVG